MAARFLFAFLVACLGCLGPVARQSPVPPGPPAVPPPVVSGAMERLDPAAYPVFEDDMALKGLAAALRQSLRYYEGQPPNRVYVFGPDRYNAAELADSTRHAIALVDKNPPDLAARWRQDFLVYRSVGMDKDRTVVHSSYYEHDLRGALKRGGRYKFPIYGRPADLERRKPYYSRKQIDSDKVLAGRKLEIAYADDPVEIFFLQVQGSGWLRLSDGRRLRLRYAGNNGLPYKSVGGHMIESGLISREKFSRETMVNYLAAHPQTRQKILNHNPRYVFFQFDHGPNKEFAYGSLNVPLTPYRSVALDHGLFPAGALGWLEVDTKNAGRRFIVNQDEGGAIKGPARLDYFVGGGPEAEKFAIQFWEKGRVYFLVRKRGGTEDGAP